MIRGVFHLCDLWIAPAVCAPQSNRETRPLVLVRKEHMAGTTLESGARRTFVKRAVQLLHQQADEERTLTKNDVVDLARSVFTAGRMDGEEAIFG